MVQFLPQSMNIIKFVKGEGFTCRYTEHKTQRSFDIWGKRVPCGPNQLGCIHEYLHQRRGTTRTVVNTYTHWGKCFTWLQMQIQILQSFSMAPLSGNQASDVILVRPFVYQILLVDCEQEIQGMFSRLASLESATCVLRLDSTPFSVVRSAASGRTLPETNARPCSSCAVCSLSVEVFSYCYRIIHTTLSLKSSD